VHCDGISNLAPHTISTAFAFFLAFGYSSISSSSDWLYNCSIGSQNEGFAVDLVGFTGPSGFDGPIDSAI